MTGPAILISLVTFALQVPDICRADALDGIWRSLGYGQIMEISGTSVTMYQEVGGKVLPSRVERAERRGTRLHFEISPFQYRSVFETALGGDMLALSELETGREILYEHLEKLPPRTTRSDDAGTSLKYFLQLFEELYPAFEDRSVDWASVSRRLRSRATDNLNESRLFALLSEALDSIGRDGHIGIRVPEGKSHSPAARLAGPMIREPNRERQVRLIQEKYLQDQVSETANGKIFFGWIEPRVGYINVQSVESMATDSALAAQRAAVDSALDELWDRFREAQGIVLDVRLNGGGFDALALMVAGLFADAEHVAFSKRARIQATDRFTEPRLFRVWPRTKSLANKKVILLTGPGTASGAEILVMATMQFPRVQRFGEPTMGILSDTYIRELPNGWTVRLYSERYYAFDGRTYEATGIPPQVKVPFTLEDLEDSRDPVLEAAVLELRGNGRNPSLQPVGQFDGCVQFDRFDAPADCAVEDIRAHED